MASLICSCVYPRDAASALAASSLPVHLIAPFTSTQGICFAAAGTIPASSNNAINNVRMRILAAQTLTQSE